jgi:hypothetical protein
MKLMRRILGVVLLLFGTLLVVVCYAVLYSDGALIDPVRKFISVIGMGFASLYVGWYWVRGRSLSDSPNEEVGSTPEVCASGVETPNDGVRCTECGEVHPLVARASGLWCRGCGAWAVEPEPDRNDTVGK